MNTITPNMKLAIDAGHKNVLIGLIASLGYERFAQVSKKEHLEAIDTLAANLVGASTATVEPPPNALDEQVGGDHYKQFPIQPGVFCETNRLTFFESDIIKRLCRHSRGGKGMQDIEKCMHELRIIAKVQYGVDL